MKFNVHGGAPVEGNTDAEIVGLIRQQDELLSNVATIEEFMARLAERIRMQGGAEVRPDSVTHFLQDLQDIRYLTPIDIPWDWIVMDTIKVGLIGPTAVLSPWRHRLLWSSIQPRIVSTLPSGQILKKYIDLELLQRGTYQMEWLQDYRNQMRRIG
jgi:hypothetical protein